MNRLLSKVLPAWALIACTLIIFFWFNKLTHVNDFKRADCYSGDGLQTLTVIRASQEDSLGTFKRNNPRLGFPFKSFWSDFPQYHLPLIWLSARITNLITKNIFITLNIVALLSHVLSALSMFYVCKIMRISTSVSIGTALLFSFSSISCAKCYGGHTFLSFFYIVPPAILALYWTATHNRITLKFGLLLCLLDLCFAMGDTYQISMFCYLLVLVCVGKWLLTTTYSSFKLLWLNTPVLLIFWCLFNLAFVRNVLLNGCDTVENPNNYQMTEWYALKPIDLILPPPNNGLNLLSSLSEAYVNSLKARGEQFTPYLGLAAQIGLIWMIVAIVKILTQRVKVRRFPIHGIMILSILAFSVPGGINGMMYLIAGSPWRATSRMSVWIGAICLIFLAQRFNRLILPRSFKICLGVFLAVVSINLQRMQGREDKTTEVGNDRKYYSLIEARLPLGAAVYVFPPMSFSDPQIVGNCLQNETLRPYLWTTHLKYSSGQIWGKKDTYWQLAVLKKPLPETLMDIQSHGFKAVLFFRSALADGGIRLQQDLESLGYISVLEDDLKTQFCVIF